MRTRQLLFASVCTALLAAFAAVSSAEAAAKNPAEKLAGESYKALSEGRTDAAIEGYGRAIGTGTLEGAGLASAYLNRGLAWQQAGKFEEAVDDYSAALHLDSLNDKLRMTAHYNRGLAQQKLGRHALAIDDFTSGLYLDSTFAHAYYARGNALRDAGQYLFALSDFEKAEHYSHPSLHLVYYSEALAYVELRRPADAAKSLSKSLAAKPDFEPARKRLAALENGQLSLLPDVKAAPAPIVTGALLPDEPDQVVRKPDLPVAIAPEADVGDETSSIATVAEVPARKKLYTGRVPETEPAPVAPAAAAEAPPPVEAVPAAAAPADMPEAAETVPAAGWTIQISSARQEDLAWSSWKKLKDRHRILADQTPVVEKAELGGKGTFYRLKLAGFTEFELAKSTCRKLKSRGISCFVSRNGA